MPSPFAGLGLIVDKPVRCYLAHPATRMPLLHGGPIREEETLEDVLARQAYLDLFSWHSQVAQSHRFLRDERLRRENKALIGEEAESDLGAMLARMTHAWGLVTLTGEKIEVECTFENARELYNSLETRWLRIQAMQFLDTEGNFLPASSTS